MCSVSYVEMEIWSVCDILLRGGSGLASNFMHKCRSVSWKLFRCVRCPIQLQELLTRRAS